MSVLTRQRARELRRSRRTPGRNAAWIVPGAGGRIPCVLWDTSETGARIAAARANDLPIVFTLVTSQRGQPRFCRVVWRKSGQLGVRFIEEAEAERLEPSRGRVQQSGVTSAAAATHGSREFDATARALILPGAGATLVREKYRRGAAVSSFALGLLLVLAAATVLFAAAGMQTADATWAQQVCDAAQNFCAHPEWTGVGAAVMSVVYLAARGMEL